MTLKKALHPLYVDPFPGILRLSVVTHRTYSIVFRFALEHCGVEFTFDKAISSIGECNPADMLLEWRDCETAVQVIYPDEDAVMPVGWVSYRNDSDESIVVLKSR